MACSDWALHLVEGQTGGEPELGCCDALFSNCKKTGLGGICMVTTYLFTPMVVLALRDDKAVASLSCKFLRLDQLLFCNLCTISIYMPVALWHLGLHC